MIEYKTGDILSENAEALVNTVNCVGVMGRGIALQFKKAFPDNFKAYAKACKREEVQPGRMFVFETGQLDNPRYIINFPTKRHWRGKSRIKDIESGLEELVHEIRERGIRSVAIPPLGSGLGGLNWGDVRPRIEQALSHLNDVELIVFEPGGAPDVGKMVRNREVPKMTAGRAALVGLIHRYQTGLLDPFISLLEVHKLMYFLQEAGEALQLRFQKAQYGPYADNLTHVLNAIEGHLISGYADGGDTPDKRLELVPGAVSDANDFLGKHPGIKPHIDRVSALIDGFESPFGLELLSTVHWVVAKEEAESIDEVVDYVYRWNSRKRNFSARQIRIAVNALKREDWIDVATHDERRQGSLNL
ncbi:MAG: macro domain-containing protein [Dehalococcoidia bacterium]|nr:macro domain-containing protein [Dehalococcoidia bacterium]